MLVLTILVVAILFYVSYLIFDKDLLAPPTVVALTFLFGSLCALYCNATWEIDFSEKSLGLITAGIIATMLGGVIGVILSNHRGGGSFTFSHMTIEPVGIYVSPVKTWLVIAFQALGIFLLFTHIRQLTGYSNWYLAVERYRFLKKAATDSEALTLRIPFLTRNIMEFSNLLGVVYAYIIGNNIVSKKKKQALNCIPLVLYSLTTFLKNDRASSIRLVLVVLVTAYTIQRRSVGWRKSRATSKIIRGMAISIVAVAVVFFMSQKLVGKKSDWDPLYYVAFYAGSPIAVLDQLWSGPIVRPDVFGQRMLYSFNQSTTALFGWPGRYSFYYDYMYSPNGSLIGNAPTSFRPAYMEFGFWGFLLFFVIFGAFFTLLYCKCRIKKGSNPIDFRLLIYAYISYVFFMYFYSTFFDFLSHKFIKFIIELLIIRWALVGWQFKKHITFTFGKSRSGPVPVQRPESDS